MREIVFDTETTGLDPAEGHRLVEFAGVELRDRVPTGRTLHCYFNPGRAMPAEAEAIHGLGDEFLRDKPPFKDKAAEILAFVDGATLVAHNAGFDMRFLDFELERAGLPPLSTAPVVDTLELARKRFPGSKHSLDALCQRFGIDRSARTLHGALIDANLLADVYIELTGGRQIGLDLYVDEGARQEGVQRRHWPERRFAVPAAEEAAHAAFVRRMDDPLWLRHGDGS